MQLIDTEIRVRHTCPFSELSAAFPEASMSHWCNGRREVLEIVSPSPDELPAILKKAKKILPDLEEVVRHGSSALTVRGCHCFEFQSVCAICDECNCWIIPPIQYYGGYETYRVMSFGNSSLNKMIKKLKKKGTVKIMSTRPAVNLDALQSIGTIPVHFFEGLTDRQLHALVSAFEKGLLEVPARSRMDKVAREEGFSRSTYGEHLRKAVYRIVQNSYPILKLYDSGLDRDDRSACRRTSR
jgi:predicted DNA binding protein